jgi:hypothetical protein
MDPKYPKINNKKKSNKKLLSGKFIHKRKIQTVEILT